MADTKSANADEGADPSTDVEQRGAHKTHGGADAHMSPTYKLDIDQPAEDDEQDDEAKELDEIHEHADPSRGGKEVDGGDRANVTDTNEGYGVKTEEKKL
jgi:hypothetical protein